MFNNNKGRGVSVVAKQLKGNRQNKDDHFYMSFGSRVDIKVGDLEIITKIL